MLTSNLAGDFHPTPWETSETSMPFSNRAFFTLTTILLLAVGTLQAGAAEAEPTTQTELTWLTDLDQAVAQARQQHTYLVVDLYAEWCGWCKKLEREVFPTPEFRAFAADKVLVRVDVEDGGAGTQLQAQHDANNLPTTLILDADLIQVGKVSGFASAAALVPRFEAEIAAWERLTQRFPQILDQGSDSLRRSLAQSLHERADGHRAALLYAKIIETAGAQAPDMPWLYYRMADAHRLAREFEPAERATAKARQLAEGQLAADTLGEKLDLLAYQIAQDAGDCQGAKTTLQRFLDSHPRSRAHRQLEGRLRALEQGDHTICA